MDIKTEICRHLINLDSLCPAGYAIALHIKFTTPTFLFQTYSKEWIDFYDQSGLVMEDPTVLWGFQNTGSVRWSELGALDTGRVLPKAAKYGMAYGFTTSLVVDGSRSVASFARADREYSDGEIDAIVNLLSSLNKLAAEAHHLSREDWAALKKISIDQTHSGG